MPRLKQDEFSTTAVPSSLCRSSPAVTTLTEVQICSGLLHDVTALFKDCHTKFQVPAYSRLLAQFILSGDVDFSYFIYKIKAINVIVLTKVSQTC